MNSNNYIAGILIIIAAICVIFNSQISRFFVKAPEKVKNDVVSVVKLTEAKDYFENVPVIQPTELSNLSKQSIYELRKNRVKNSIFNIEGYEPSESVFGQIESYKPWIANDICKDPQTKVLSVTGPSEEARFINNPALLVAIEYPFSFNDYEDASWCTDSETTLIPKKITYNRARKEINVTYSRLPFLTDDGFSFYIFNGVNARDLGYNYAYVDKAKSTYDIEFSNDYNISKEVVEFQNFIHLGGSCGTAGGCNNGSPRQTFLEFKQNDTDFMNYDKEIYIKLWKNRPNSYDDEPDMIEKIILEES